MVTDPLDRPILSHLHGRLIFLEENVDVAKAVREMHSRRAEIVIVTKDGKPVGIVTDSDVLDKVVIKGEDSDQILLKSIASSPVVTLSANGTVRQALELMRVNVIKHIPVTDNIHILGLVTQEELANAIRTSVLERAFRNYRSIIRYHYEPILGNLGFVMQFAGILLLAPAILATILNETETATGIFLGLTSMSSAGFVLNAYGEKVPLNLKQASILIVSSFVLLSFFGSIPYMYVNPFEEKMDPSLSLFVNSLFESASGFTTTGLSVITQPEELPQSFDLYRSYTQWVGGLSFVYLVVMLFYPEKKLVHMRGMIGGGLLRSKQLIITISIIFTIYTAALSVLLYSLGSINNLNSIAIVFSTITGGGFVPTSMYVSGEHVIEMLVLMAGMIISALPFAFHYAVFSKEVKTTQLRPEVLMYFGIILISIVAFHFLLSEQAVRLDWFTWAFHTVSASTNSGFQYINMSSIPFESKILLILIMLIGGCAFSTAGGIKVGRLLYIVQKFIKRKISIDTSSRSISSVSSRYNKSYSNYEGKAVKLRDDKTFKESSLVISLFILLSFITGTVLSYFAQRNFIDSLFESVSALTTTGLSTGITTLSLDLVSKTFLIINMVAGRFEIIAILYIFFGTIRKI